MNCLTTKLTNCLTAKLVDRLSAKLVNRLTAKLMNRLTTKRVDHLTTKLVDCLTAEVVVVNLVKLISPNYNSGFKLNNYCFFECLLEKYLLGSYVTTVVNV